MKSTKILASALVLVAGLALTSPASASDPNRGRRTDFNGDGKDDIITFGRDVSADVYVALSTGSGFSGTGVKWHDLFCYGLRIPGTGDFNGDGKDDIVKFWRDSGLGFLRGDVHVALSTGSGFGPTVMWHDWFCLGDEIPLVGDFNGDGKDDIISFAGVASGDVYVALSTGSSFSGTGVKWDDDFYTFNQIPGVGDFNGDGKDDIVVFLREVISDIGRGDIWVALSTGSGFGARQKWHDWFCLGNEIPLVGDFNGDGKDDIVTFSRGDSGDVYVALSTGSSFSGTGIKWHDWFCFGNEIPLVGDFNGDGKADIATFAHETKTGDGRGDVYVALSTGSSFSGTGVKWHDWFSIADDMPTTMAAVFPQYMFASSYEGGDHTFVGYYSEQEDWFANAVFEFKDEFESTWPCDHHYYGQHRFMHEDHLEFVDSADLAYVAGHGNISFIRMSSGEDCDLTECAWGSWSSNSRRGDLEYIAFDSCRVLALRGDCWGRWMCTPNQRRPFAGLHVACGFRNEHQDSPVFSLGEEFAEKLEDGYSVRWAWLEAADNEDKWVWEHHNMGCVLYLEPHEHERYWEHNERDRWWHDSDYELWQESWE